MEPLTLDRVKPITPMKEAGNTKNNLNVLSNRGRTHITLGYSHVRTTGKLQVDNIRQGTEKKWNQQSAAAAQQREHR